MNRNKFKAAYKASVSEDREIPPKFRRGKRFNAKDRVQKTRARIAINYGDFKTYLEEQSDLMDEGNTLKSFGPASQND